MRRVSQFLIFAVLVASGCGQKPAPAVDLAGERQRMVQEQLMPRGVHDKRVLAAMSKVPREEFVPQDSRAASYTDQPLPIGYGQTISQPKKFASMPGHSPPTSGHRILDIATAPVPQARSWGELVWKLQRMQLRYPFSK